MILYYLRHGDPIYDPDSLTEYGHVQADALSKRLKYSGLDYLFSSPSNRARLTAKHTADALNLPVEIEDFLSEDITWGEFTLPLADGKSRAWIFQIKELVKLLNSDQIRNMGFTWYDHPAFSDTKCKQGCIRMRNAVNGFMAKLGLIYNPDEHCFVTNDTFSKYHDKKVGVFAHEGTGALFISTLLDIPYPYVSRFEMNTTGMTVIRLDADKNGVVIPKLLQFNNDSHLYKEGLSTALNKGTVI